MHIKLQIELMPAGTKAQRAELTYAATMCRRSTDVGQFVDTLYQWAATLTSSGQNLPFALPQRVDKLSKPSNGFLVSANHGPFN